MDLIDFSSFPSWASQIAGGESWKLFLGSKGQLPVLRSKNTLGEFRGKRDKYLEMETKRCLEVVVVGFKNQT